MDTNNRRTFSRCSYIGRQFFDGIDNSLRKRHEVNNFLAFGFRKDDVVLEPMKDRWTDAESVPLARLNFWVNNKLLQYLNHWASIPERSANNEILSLLCSDVEEVLRKLHKDLPKDPSGIEYASIYEIKMAIALCIVIFVVGQRGFSVSADGARNELNEWKERVDCLVIKKFSNSRIPREEKYKPVQILFDEINQLVLAHS
jgi:hypothetical protein